MTPEDFLETITSNSPSYIMVLDNNGLIRFVNRTTRNLDKKSVLGQSAFDYVASQEEADKLRACFDRVTKHQKPELLESKAINSEGRISYWESRISPVMENGVPSGFVIITNNITKRVSAQLEQQAIFDLSADFLCVLKFDGYFGRVNPAFVTKLGYSEEELLSTPVFDFIHPEDRQVTLDAFTRVREEHHKLPPFENRYVAKDGSLVIIEWLGSVDREANRVIGIGRDVTANRELEQQLRQSQKMEAIGQLAGGIAHDFNNLLMAISANTELGLLSDNLDKVRSRLRDIEAASERAAELTRKLLSFSRNQPLQKAPLDLNLLIQNLLRLLERVLPPNIQLTFQPELNLPLVAADKLQLEQVLMNLCVNARDAMPDGGHIALSTGRIIDKTNDAQVTVDVSDSGTGIPESIKERIYNPFFTTKPEGHGTGLGLSMVYSIMQKHNGTVTIHDTTDKGTTMRITLPPVKAADKSKIALNQSLPFGGSETILVADDEQLVAKITKETLEKAGYTVVVASNGQQAIELCKNNPAIQLAFLDVMMPQMNGPDAAAIIKQDSPQLPILFATGYAADSHKTLQDKYHVLHKPYRGDELLNMIRKLLDEPHSH